MSVVNARGYIPHPYFRTCQCPKCSEHRSHNPSALLMQFRDVIARGDPTECRRFLLDNAEAIAERLK